MSIKPAQRQGSSDERDALLLTGAVGRLRGINPKGASIATSSTDLYDEAKGPYTPLRVTGAGIVKHILEPNARPGVDVFVHSWTPDLEQDFETIFHPVKAKFEDNRLYQDTFSAKPGDYRQVSWAYSMRSALQLMLESERERHMTYRRVIFYRPDVILLKDIVLDDILKNKSRIYINRMGRGAGDFHFIMTRENALEFGKLYDSISNTWPARIHFWIPDYLTHNMSVTRQCDKILPGRDEEVYRKIPFSKINCSSLRDLGFTDDDAVELNMTC